MMNYRQWCSGICKGEGLHASPLPIWQFGFFCITNNKMTFPNKKGRALNKDRHQEKKRSGLHKLPLQVPLSSLQVSLALGLLILTAGIASLSVSYSTPHKIEAFGEGDLFFVDAQAASFNRGLHFSVTAGIGLSCLGSALAAMGVVVWILPRANLKERLFHRPVEGEQRGESRSKWKGFMDQGDVVTNPPGIEEGKIPVTLSKVENVQPTP